MYDFCIIGGGVVGSAIARELSRYKADVVVLEAELDVAGCATAANSGIVFSECATEHDSSRAYYSNLGAKLFKSYVRVLDVPYIQSGSIIAASTQSEEDELGRLLKAAEQGGASGKRLLSRDAALTLQPNLAEGITKVLYSPSDGIVDPLELNFALRENAEFNGVEYRMDFRVARSERVVGGTAIYSQKGECCHARVVINCSGASGGEVSAILGDPITLARLQAEYLALNPISAIKLPIMGVPSVRSKGFGIAPTLTGGVLVGARVIPGTHPRGRVQIGAHDALLQAASKLVDCISEADMLNCFAGSYAVSATGDFIIGRSKKVSNLINVIGIESHGLTAAPAIALKVARSFLLEERSDFSPSRRSIKRVIQMTEDERNAAISAHPAYGSIVCSCSGVSEAEIIAAIRRGARTYEGVKKRLKAGMGRCQGSSCLAAIITILARELAVSPEDILKSSPQSNILIREDA